MNLEKYEGIRLKIGLEFEGYEVIDEANMFAILKDGVLYGFHRTANMAHAIRSIRFKGGGCRKIEQEIQLGRVSYKYIIP